MNLLNYLGLSSIAYYVSSIIVMGKLSESINFNRHAVSDLAKSKRFGKIFSFSMFIFATCQAIFAIYASKVIAGVNSTIPTAFFTLAGVSLLLASVNTTKNQSHKHSIYIGVSGVSVTVAITFLSLILLSENPSLGFLALFGSILIPLSFFLKTKLSGAKWEYVLLSGIGMCNLALTIQLL